MNDAYAAGLFDGEGYVRIDILRRSEVNTRYQVIAGIGMTYRPIIQQLHAAYGGSMNQNRHDLRNQNARIQYTWHIASQVAASFFRKILPHLVVKREEVELALLLQEDIDRYRTMLGNRFWFHPDRDAIFARRKEIANQITALKKRTFPPLPSPGRTGRPPKVKIVDHPILTQ